MDFEESLPSSSTFVGHETGLYNLVHNFDQSYEGGLRSPSPPPPPPPPLVSDDSRMPHKAQHEQQGEKAAVGTKPFKFLRKNSRKEPSALHRITSGSSSPVDPSNQASSSPESTPTGKPPRNFAEDRPSNHATTVRHTPNTSVAINADPRDRLGETMERSTVTIAGEHWRQQQRAAIQELDEFEQIERSLASGESYVAPTAPSRTSFPSATTATRPVPLNETVESADSGGWGDDAYAAEETYRSIKSRRSQPLEDEYAADEFDDYGEGEQEDRSYGRRSTAGDESSQPATRPAPVRPQSPNASSARPMSSHAAEQADRDRRASESPSWGRVTQPVQHSFDSADHPGEDQYYNNASGGYGATVGAGSVSSGGGRLADSALRKITARTAALQHNTRPAVERPTLADDTSPSHPVERPEPVRAVSHTRPMSTQRRLASTMAAPAAGRGQQDKHRSGSAGRGRGAPTHTTAAEYTEALLAERAKELEAEIQTYRAENASLKKVRRQQEQALAEVVAQKEEVLRWAAEEKTRVAKWCEEQQAAATRERNAAAKAARDLRQQAATVPIRKEKAEMEALQATIEKMKLDHEQALKKWKLTENRLTAQSKEHCAHAEELKRQVLALEHEKLQLLEFIGKEGLIIPKALRNTLQRSTRTGGADGSATSGGGSAGASGRGGRGASAGSAAADALRGRSSRGGNGADGYVEEVDVDVVDATSSHYFDDGEVTTTAVGSTLHPPRKGDSTSPRSSSTVGAPGAVTASARVARSASAPRGSSAGSAGLSRGGALSGAPGGRDSWSRSSRSSRSSAGRYEDCEASDRDDQLEKDSFHVSEVAAQRRSQDRTASTTASAARSPVLANTAKSTPASTSGALTSSAQPLASTAPVSTTALASQAGSGREVEHLSDGGTVVRYKNGTVKEVDKAGNSTVRFQNGDIKTVNAISGSVVYFYAEAQTTHTTFSDGLEVYEFPNKQVEMHFPDGVKEIIFPDKTRKVIRVDGVQESYFPDGVLLREHPDGRREVLSHEEE